MPAIRLVPSLGIDASSSSSTDSSRVKAPPPRLMSCWGEVVAAVLLAAVELPIVRGRQHFQMTTSMMYKKGNNGKQIFVIRKRLSVYPPSKAESDAPAVCT